MSDNPKWTDIAVAFFTVCLVGVAIWQGIIFKHQWQKMHSGGVDTHDLAVAAQEQASAAKSGVQPIPPQGGYQISVAQTGLQVLSNEGKTRIDSQEYIVWVWGSIEYEDIFDNQHVTRFCGYTLDVTSDQSVREGELLKSCPEYSDMN